MATSNMIVGFQGRLRKFKIVCIVAFSMIFVLVAGCDLDFVVTHEPIGEPVDVKDLAEFEGVWKFCPEDDGELQGSGEESDDIFGIDEDDPHDDPESEFYFVRAVGPGELTVGRVVWDKGTGQFGMVSGKVFVRSIGEARFLFVTEPGATGYLFFRLVLDPDGTLKLCAPNAATFNKAITDGEFEGKVVNESSFFGFKSTTILVTLDTISMNKLLKEKGMDACFEREAIESLQRITE